MKYRAGYKYQLHEDASYKTRIFPGQNVDTRFIMLSTLGLLTCKAGYAWDGPSGPTVDTPSFMRGSLFHDALYQLLREKHLFGEADRKQADEILREVCLQDGMMKIRAWWVYKAVRIGAKNSSENGRAVLEAP